VVFAWELGNELHTPADPAALIPFVTEASADVRALDPDTPILPGTMGANHVEPRNAHSSVARWLYCEAPVDAYTLHAYDWVSRERPGDMPIDWDLDNIVAEPCPNGRSLPVIVEELGTSRDLAGLYSKDDERGRIQQELRQIEFVRRFSQVIGFGVWNAESPRLVDRTFVDTRRGLTSYGANARGGGSCYDPTPDAAPGARCQLEQFLRDSRFVRLAGSDQWTPAPGVDATDSIALMGRIDAVIPRGDNATSLTISGWLFDPAASDSPGIDTLEVFAGPGIDAGIPLARAQLGLTRADQPSSLDNPDFAHAGFSLSLPLEDVPLGATWLTLAAHTPDHGTWLSTMQVVIPNLGGVPAPRVVARVSTPPAPNSKQRLFAEIESPQPGDMVPRSFVLQMLAPDAGRVDVFLEPDRDNGGRRVGSASAPADSTGNTLKTTVSAPAGSHTLYIHVTSADQDQLLTLPVVIRS